MSKRMVKSHSPLSSSDLKRLEEVFFTPPKEKPVPKKSRTPLLFTVISLFAVLTFAVIYLKYTVLFVPKIPLSDENLLSSRFLRSVIVTKDEMDMQFSQGVLYLALQPSGVQEVTLNTKAPIDLEKNDLLLHLSLIDPAFQNGDITGTVTVKNSDYFSNALHPAQVTFDTRFLKDPKNKYFVIPVGTGGPGEVQMNFSHIIQVRIEFENQKDKPVSLLVREIKLTKKEGE